MQYNCRQSSENIGGRRKPEMITNVVKFVLKPNIFVGTCIWKRSKTSNFEHTSRPSSYDRPEPAIYWPLAILPLDIQNASSSKIQGRDLELDLELELAELEVFC